MLLEVPFSEGKKTLLNHLELNLEENSSVMLSFGLFLVMFITFNQDSLTETITWFLFVLAQCHLMILDAIPQKSMVLRMADGTPPSLCSLLCWKTAELVVFIKRDGYVVALFLLICIFIKIEVRRGAGLFAQPFSCVLS